MAGGDDIACLLFDLQAMTVSVVHVLLVIVITSNSTVK